MRLAREAGLDVTLGPELLTLRHGVTRFRITMACFEAEHGGGEFRSDFYRQGLWVAPQRLPDYPVSAPQRRLAKVLLAPQRQRTLF
jgi:A/G-specific adenine glycosylase